MRINGKVANYVQYNRQSIVILLLDLLIQQRRTLKVNLRTLIKLAIHKKCVKNCASYLKILKQ